MALIDIWGWACAVVGGLFALPQVVRLLRAQTSVGLSELNWRLLLGSNIGWVLHGVHTGRAQIIVPNLALAICSFLIIRMIRRDRGLSMMRGWAIPLAVAVVPFALEFVVGAVVFGLLINIPQVVGACVQLRDMVRSSSLAGVSFLYLFLTGIVQVMWIIWAVGVGENAVIVAAGAMAIVSFTNAIYFGLRHVGVLRGPALVESV